MTNEGVKPLKTQQASISKIEANEILDAISKLDLESKEVEENGWQLKMYKSNCGKNRLVKTIEHDAKNPDGMKEFVQFFLLNIYLYLGDPIIHGRKCKMFTFIIDIYFQ